MTKRALGAILWFAALSFGYEILWSVADVPRPLGPVLGLAVSVVVGIDPGRRLWASAPAAEPAVVNT